MDKILAIILMIALSISCFAVGLTVSKNDVQIIEIPGEDVVVNQTELVEKPVTDTSLILDSSVEDFMKEVKSESSLRYCDENKYSLSEISLEEVEDEYFISIDEEDYTINFVLEIKYKESDLRACYKTYIVSAFYEESEDVDFSY